MATIHEQLKQKGYRLTQPRIQVLDVLTFHPQSVARIVSSIRKKHASIDITTVYRTLEVLVDMGVVGKTHFDGKTAMFELLSKQTHHHHLICKGCGFIEDIPLDEGFIMRQVNNHTKFQVLGHSLEFFGLCASCQ